MGSGLLGREVVRMTIGGLELGADVGRRAGEPAGWSAAERAAAAAAAAGLGMAARLAALLAALLDVPLRYPIRFAGSRSSMLEHPQPAARPACAHLPGRPSAPPKLGGPTMAAKRQCLQAYKARGHPTAVSLAWLRRAGVQAVGRREVER